MKLNLEIIQEYLPKEYETRRYGSFQRTCAYTRPLLYENDQPFLEDTLYIAYAERLPRGIPPKSCAFVAVGSRVPAEWILGGVPLLAVTNVDSVGKVFNTVQTLYNRFDQWDAQLRDELEKEMDFDLRKILKLGAAQLRRNISVMNYALQMIFQIKWQEGISGTSRIVVDDRPETMSIDYSEIIKEVCNLERVITVPYMSAIEDHSHQHYCFNLYIAGRFAGCISIGEENRPFEEGDFPVMDHFYAVFQKAFLKYHRSYVQEDLIGPQALRKLLDHMPLTPEEEQQLQLPPGDKWCCFRLRECRKGKTLPRDYMYATVNAIIPKTIYAVLHHEEIVGLIRLQEQEKQETLAIFEQTLQRMGYYGGISHSFTDMARLNDYFNQAAYAALQGGEAGASVHYFRDYVLVYMLSACTGDLSGESLLSDGLLALREHDSKKGTDYLKTLDVYLQNEMSITKTSQALFIHRSSFQKRLEKITRLLECDLSDPDTRLYYRLCLALMKKNSRKSDM